jgi:Fe2+ transport system protein B
MEEIKELRSQINKTKDDLDVRMRNVEEKLVKDSKEFQSDMKNQLRDFKIEILKNAEVARDNIDKLSEQVTKLLVDLNTMVVSKDVHKEYKEKRYSTITMIGSTLLGGVVSLGVAYIVYKLGLGV